MHSDNAIDQNIDRIAQLFPNCITEIKASSGDIERAIDFDKLKAELSCPIAEGNTQRYQFTWPDKSEASRLANTPTTSCLRPCRDESVDFDHTQNLYIEGDNLEVLKVLRHTYSGKVKMIYIDPPYNTGNDFVYEDDFACDQEEYLLRSGQKDESGNQLVANPKSNGRFHTDWLNMIYPRLKLARELLSEDGVIFISIDNNEYSSLFKICTELFGENNFLGEYIKQSKVGGGNDSKFIVKEHEYCICFSKNCDKVMPMKIGHSDEYLKRYKEQDEYGKYFWDTFARPGLKHPIIYKIEAPDGTLIENGWIRSESRFKSELKEGKIRIIKKKDGEWSVQFKQYLNEQGKTPRSLTMDFGGSSLGDTDLKKLFSEKVFSYPKSLQFLSTLINTIRDQQGIVLDFFSGSSTTAHAVMHMNASDGGNRKFIMVQLPEELSQDSEGFKAGYKNICEIGKERIRRAGAAIKEEFGEKAADLDIGFRVLKLDSSNMKDTYYVPAKLTMASLIADNLKEDRTSEDLLFQALLETDVLLSEKIGRLNIGGKEVFSVSDGFVMACFDNELDMETIKEIASQQPSYFITRYESFNGDALIDNLDQIFAAYSSHTIVKII